MLGCAIAACKIDAQSYYAVVVMGGLSLCMYVRPTCLQCNSCHEIHDTSNYAGCPQSRIKDSVFDMHIYIVKVYWQIIMTPLFGTWLWTECILFLHTLYSYGRII